MLASVSTTPSVTAKVMLNTSTKTQPVSIPLDSPVSSPPSAPRNVRKAHPVRRRRRAAVEGDDSEDEIIRAARSGSDSEGPSPLGESASESEDDLDIDAAQPAESVTSVEPVAAPSITVNGKTSPIQPPVAQPETVFPAVQDWSEMVTTELDGGDSSLPVIDFADFGPRAHGVVTPALTEGTTPPEAGVEEAKSVDAPRADNATVGPSEGSSGPRHPSARQAYLDQLNNDPSFIPRVGAFWGHDDRLLDKGLRSMSPWWRERQTSFRGRGRGGFEGGRGGFEGSRGDSEGGRGGFERGRGGFSGGGGGFDGGRGGFEGGRGTFDGGFVPGGRGRGGRGRGGYAASYGGRGEAEPAPAPAELAAEPVVETAVNNIAPLTPPVDRHWGHDGFEEMRKTEEQRQAAFRGRGRGSFDPSLRGARGGMRGGFVPRGGFIPRGGMPFNNGFRHPNGSGPVFPGPKQFYRRAEKAVTVDNVAYLFDDNVRSRDNQESGIRLKLPGSPASVVVRLPAVAMTKTEATVGRLSNGTAPLIVKLPLAAKREQKDLVSQSAEASGDFAQTMDIPLVGTPPAMEIVSEVNEPQATVAVIPSATASITPSILTATAGATSSTTSTAEPAPSIPQGTDSFALLAHLQAAGTLVAQKRERVAESLQEVEALLKQEEMQAAAAISSGPAEASSSTGPPVPALASSQQESNGLSQAVVQTIAPPANIPGPHYPPPFGYGLPLPPGIAVGDGFYYEVATGRPVILNPPLPSQMQPLYETRPMHAPQPLLHNVNFLPPLVRPMSNMSPGEFIPSPFSMSPDGQRSVPGEVFSYPMVEVPPESFFIPRRESGPVSIRAPGEVAVPPSSSTEKPKVPTSALPRSAVHAPPFQPAYARQMAPMPGPYATRLPFFPSWDNSGPAPSAYRPDPYDASGQPPAGMHHPLPDDPAIVGRDPAIQEGQQGPYQYYLEPQYGYGMGEYGYAPYGYEAPHEGQGPSGANRPSAPVFYY